MSVANAEWLDEANKKYESCAYSGMKGIAGGCVLDGYPILDCPGCKSYKEKDAENEGGVGEE